MDANWIVSCKIIDKEARRARQASVVFSANIPCIPETILETMGAVCENAARALEQYKNVKANRR